MTYRLSTDFINGAVTRILLLFDRPSYMHATQPFILQVFQHACNTAIHTYILTCMHHSHPSIHTYNRPSYMQTKQAFIHTYYRHSYMNATQFIHSIHFLHECNTASHTHILQTFLHACNSHSYYIPYNRHATQPFMSTYYNHSYMNATAIHTYILQTVLHACSIAI